jgi:hypothetical protein
MRILLQIAACGLMTCAPLAARAEEAPPDFQRGGRPFLEKHCLDCHSGAKPEAELSLDVFRDGESLVRKRKVWERVVRMVNAGEMPPADQPQPTLAEKEAFLEQIRAIFDYADRHAKPDPGRVTMRRLNRVEYRNTIRDLIGVDFDPTADFPSDDIGHGFDNIGDVLTISPVLMERYLAAAEGIMSRAITPNPPPPIKRHLSALYTEPASGDVGKRLIEGNYRRMTSDGQEAIEVGPLNTPYQWEDDGEYTFRTRVYGRRDDGKPVRIAILVHGKDLPEASNDDELAQLTGNVQRPAKILQTFEIKADKPDNAERLEVRVPPMAGRHRMQIALVKPAEGEPPAKLWVEHFALEGPLDMRPASQRRLLATSSDKSLPEQTREVLIRFLRRAFRRTPTSDEVARSVALVDEQIAAGEKWEAAVQFAMQAALCSPKFLFRVELDDRPTSPEIRPVDEFHLASRMSYFLWSTMPDDELLNLAEQKQLTANLDAQVKRMLADPKAKALVQNFALQWLQIQRIEWIAPDGAQFPAFNDKLRAAMLEETVLFFESVLREDRSILDLIDADYTFLNEPLARHYGIDDTNGNWQGQMPERERGEPIRGEQFRRVNLQGGSRGGLLTQASVLTVTSNPTRTSPVKRGRWVLEQILGAPPPPPPPNVPELPADEKAIAGGSLRARLEEHRANPSCANCHAKMDPIGFALENYNAIGAYRTKDGEFEIDASGELTDGTRFSGPDELKKVIRERKTEFTRCLAEKMLIYALGRGLEYYDRPTVEKIITNTAASDYRFSTLITEIVKSDAFRLRRGSDEAAPSGAAD